jgi:hypothetical protein
MNQSTVGSFICGSIQEVDDLDRTILVLSKRLEAVLVSLFVMPRIRPPDLA